jgi:hypothetical protein
VYLGYCCLQLTLAFQLCLQILVFGKLLNIYYTVTQFLIICLGFMYRQTFKCFIYIYNISFHVKGGDLQPNVTQSFYLDCSCAVA